MNNYNYTEEHYAEMYNNLSEGLKDLVLSGRLAIQVAAIGTRHGLNADQVADLEPAVEDVCLGLILKADLANNIKTQVGVDDRVANRVAAEVEIEILRPFEPELVIARQQKEDLDKKINGGKKDTSKDMAAKSNAVAQPAPAQSAKEEFEPKNISEHSNVTAIKNFYNSGNTETSLNNDKVMAENKNANFDWDNFGKAPTAPSSPDGLATPSKEGESPVQQVVGVEAKLDKLTDTINKLVETRFGGEKKEEGVSDEMKKILERLEKAEKENQENKNLIKKLQGEKPVSNVSSKEGDIAMGNESKIKIDKPRTVDIDKSNMPITNKVADDVVGNVQVKSISQSIPIQKVEAVAKPEVHMYSSTVTQDTADTIVETRNKETANIPVTTSTKKVLSLDELIAKGDAKIKENKSVGQLTFPSVSQSKQIDIKNIAQTDSLKQTLLEDLEFIKKRNATKIETLSQSEGASANVSAGDADDEKEERKDVNDQQVATTSTASTTNLFKDELIPKTKEDRMKALQDKIKAMNKGVSSGGANSIAATALDPYKL